MAHMQENTNQQQQQEQAATTYAEYKPPMRKTLILDEEGQLTIGEEPIPSQKPSTVAAAPVEVVVEQVPEPQQVVAEVVAAPPQYQHAQQYYPYAGFYPPPPQQQLRFDQFWAAPMNMQGPQVPAYDQPGAEWYYGADGNLPGPSNVPPPPPPQQPYFGSMPAAPSNWEQFRDWQAWQCRVAAQQAQHFATASLPMVPSPEPYGAATGQDDLMTEPSGKHEESAQAPENQRVDDSGFDEMDEMVEGEEAMEMEEVVEVDKNEVVEMPVGEDELDVGDIPIEDLENSTDDDELNMSFSDLLYQLLEDEEAEEMRGLEAQTDKHEEGTSDDSHQGALREVDLEEDREQESMDVMEDEMLETVEEPEEDSETARKMEDLKKKKAEEEEKSRNFIEKLLKEDLMKSRKETLRNRAPLEKPKRKLTANQDKRGERLAKKHEEMKVRRIKFRKFEKRESTDPENPEYAEVLRDIERLQKEEKRMLTTYPDLDSENEDENYDPQESRRTRSKQKAKKQKLDNQKRH